MARPIVLIPHLFRLADAINFKKDYSPPSSRHLDPFKVASSSSGMTDVGACHTVDA